MKRSRPLRRISSHHDFGFDLPQTIPTLILIRELNAFLEENFRGAYTIDVVNDPHGNLRISPMIFSFMLRTLFNEVYGKARIDFHFETTPDRVLLKIAFPNVSIEEIKIAELYRLSESARIEIQHERNGLLLGFRMEQEEFLRVYVGSDLPVYRALRWIFFRKR